MITAPTQYPPNNKGPSGLKLVQGGGIVVREGFYGVAKFDIRHSFRRRLDSEKTNGRLEKSRQIQEIRSGYFLMPSGRNRRRGSVVESAARAQSLIGTIVRLELRDACANRALVLRGKAVLKGSKLMNGPAPAVGKTVKGLIGLRLESQWMNFIIIDIFCHSAVWNVVPPRLHRTSC